MHFLWQKFSHFNSDFIKSAPRGRIGNESLSVHVMVYRLCGAKSFSEPYPDMIKLYVHDVMAIESKMNSIPSTIFWALCHMMNVYNLDQLSLDVRNIYLYFTLS